MRYVKARKEHKCSFCKEQIEEGELCVQSEGNFGLFWHEECHKKRFQGSVLHEPKITSLN